MNQEIRQKALRGEWQAEIGKPAYVIKPSKNNAIELSDAHYGERTFPTEELAAEYLQVAEGTWGGKQGDHVFFYNAFTGETEDYVKWNDMVRAEGPWKHFPSAEQRSAFIAKRKGEEPSVKEKVHEFVKNFQVKHAKPQTIEICISEEAIERTANNLADLDLAYDDGVKAVIRATIALLHLEATLAK